MDWSCGEDDIELMFLSLFFPVLKQVGFLFSRQQMLCILYSLHWCEQMGQSTLLQREDMTIYNTITHLRAFKQSF